MRFAIVGVGDISRRYLDQGVIDPRIEFVGTAARSIESARTVAEEYGIPAWFDDAEAMYDAVAPDVVIVATPSAHHVAPTLAALKRGIHVVCEKPMATTYADCVAMVEAARENGVLLRLQSDPGIMNFAQREYLRVDTIGQFTGAEAEILIPGPVRDNWYYDSEVAGGGAMLDTLVYPVSAIVGLLGPVRRVTGFANTLIPHRLVSPTFPRDPETAIEVESDVDDNVTLVLEWETGQHAVVRALWGTSFARLDCNVFGRTGTLFGGSFGGTAVLHSPARPAPGLEPVEYRGMTDCYRIPMPDPAEARFGGLDLFMDAIEGKREPTWSGEQQLHVHEILFRGYEAARTGQTQELETTFDPWRPLDPAFYETRAITI
jgi:predicted dehydrogenase